uniref:PX domain-containing protein n=1 Tax=Panagrellus redivivus TaxID=6233 RepID=A0A7E4VIP8_PANRE
MSTLLPDESHCKSDLGTLVYEGRKSNVFSAAVVDHREVTGLFSHVEYDVVVTAESTDKIFNESRKFKAVTRFKDMSKLHGQLQTIHKQLYLKDKFPNFPAGMVWGSNAPEVTLERKKAIGIFLQFAVNNEVLCKTKVLQAFFDTFEELVGTLPPSTPAEFPPSDILTSAVTSPAPVNAVNRQASTISGPEELTEEEERPVVSPDAKDA